MMNASPLPTVSAAQLMADPVAPADDLLAPLIARNGSVLVHGAAGIGKTFFALGVAWAAATGGGFLGWRAARPNRVVYIDGELGADGMRKRLALFGTPPPGLQFFLPDRQRGPLLDLTRIETQHALMESWGDPELVIADCQSSLAALRGGKRWDRLHHFLQRQKNYGRAMLVVGGVNADGAPSGSRQRATGFDLVIGLRRPRDWRPTDGACFEIAFDKARHLAGERLQPLRARLVTEPPAGARWQWNPVISRLERAGALLKSGVEVKAMAEVLGVSLATGYRLRERACRLGLLPGSP